MIHTLTLSPSRASLDAVFPQGTHAYVFPTVPVRRAGVILYPEPLRVQVGDDGLLWVELTPQEDVDSKIKFQYTVAVFDGNGLSIFTHTLTMPDRDVNMWELIPERIDPDTGVAQ